MQSRRIVWIAAALAVTIGGCTSSGDAPAPSAAVAPATVAESDPGPGVCGEQIAAFRRVLKQDLDMGFLGKDVYATVTPKVESAAVACRGGQDAKAQAMLEAAKRQHGYRA